MTAPPPTGGWPAWFAALVEVATGVGADQLSAFPAAPPGARRGAVLMLFGEGPRGPEVLLIERAREMRSHPGQPAFPGGAVDPGDESAAAAAVREAVEETGLDPRGVDVVASLPPLWLPPSGFLVTPVLAWWREPSAVAAVDPAEVASVHRVPVAELVDPANRFVVRLPRTGSTGPAFAVAGLLVWGFTGGLLDRLLHLAQLDRPWDRSRLHEVPVAGVLDEPGGAARPVEPAR